VLPEKNMAYLKIQTLRLSAFMIRIASSGSFFGDSGKEVEAVVSWLSDGTWSLASGGLSVTASKGKWPLEPGKV
jgi:hypothetical protein